MTDAGVTVPLHKNRVTTVARISNFYGSSRFEDRNLLGKLYTGTEPVTLSYWSLPGGEGSWTEYPFDVVLNQTFTPTELGGSYGPTWTTHWFKVDFTIPDTWLQREVRFHWVSGTEATIWSSAGKVLQGLSTGTSYQYRAEYILTPSFDGANATQTIYVEAVASRLFGVGDGDNINPTDTNFYFSVTTAELTSMDRQIYKLTRDLEVLYQLTNELSDDPRGYMAMHTANQMINTMLTNDYDTASTLADNFFTKGNGERVHNLKAIGNCHIDTAWLWPYSETKRKVARSFSNQLRLMELFPDYKFVASQAQQWAWCQEHFSDLFDEVKPYVTSGQFRPVGTTWVEMDGNIPSGESFIRQFFFGRKFYQSQLGYVCNEFWLPDTFGYSAQIPAMMRHMNLSRFLTQKMSWSLVNKFPHHNFIWEGIDGSKVLAHFPPGDNYTMSMTVSELKKTENNLEDKGRVSTSAFLYGYGDGGGGPTEDMIQRATRLADADGCPTVTFASPDDLFTQLEAEQDNLMTWVGELYLELHNGTYTSQAQTKSLCRQSEFHLRDSEFLLTCAVINGGGAIGSILIEEMGELETAWKKVLLNQFHDVLPGSSIEIVYPEANLYFDQAIATADEVYDASCVSIFGSGPQTTVVMNTLQWPRHEVVEIVTPIIKKQKIPKKGKVQTGKASLYYLVDAPSFGYATITSVTPNNALTYQEDVINGTHILDNGLLRAEISAEGQIVSLINLSNNRDLFQRSSEQKYGNILTLYDDEPLYYDAWDIMDYHLETATILNGNGASNVTAVAKVEEGELTLRLSWSMTLGDSSTLSQDIVLKADTPYLTFETTVHWQESHRLLKVGFDTNLLARNASFDIQFGHIQRATHMNTSWDTARYEVCGHKWADLSEPDVGMAVLNDSKYGWNARGGALYLSLLKSPKAPDATCDMKTHFFSYAVMPHNGTLQEAEVMRRSYEFNNALRLTSIDTDYITANDSWSLFDVTGDGIVLHTIKPADDVSSDIILRLFESDGNQSSVSITINEIAVSVDQCDGIENIITSVPFTANQTNGTTTIDISLTPFQIYALRIKFFSAKNAAKRLALKGKGKKKMAR